MSAEYISFLYDRKGVVSCVADFKHLSQIADELTKRVRLRPVAACLIGEQSNG